LHVIRACAGVLSAVAAIFAYSRVPLTDFYAIVFAGPLLVTVLSAVWLGEKVDRARWLAIGAGFIGILVMAQPFQAESATHPSTPTVMLGRAAALLSVFGYALSVIMVRRMHIGESSLTFSFFGYSVAIVGGLIISSVLNPPALTTGDIAHLALSGTFSGLGGLCLMEAYHRAPIAMVAPFQYTQIFWGALASFVLWHTVPSPTLIVGASIVAASGLFILYRNRRGKP
jgi:drug/metabolite transporter (DMT)-like permease